MNITAEEFWETLTHPKIEYLRHYNIPDHVGYKLPGARLNSGLIIRQPDGTFIPGLHGEKGAIEAIILPTDIDCHSQIVDLVAFQPKNPSKSWTWYGQADFINGWELPARGIEYQKAISFRQISTQEPLLIHANPLELLRHGGVGIVALNRKPQTIQKLRQCSEHCGLIFTAQGSASGFAEEITGLLTPLAPKFFVAA